MSTRHGIIVDLRLGIVWMIILCIRHRILFHLRVMCECCCCSRNGQVFRPWLGKCPTSMHSSRMCTARLLTVSRGIGGCLPGGCLPRGCLPQCMLGYTFTPWTEFSWKHYRENIWNINSSYFAFSTWLISILLCDINRQILFSASSII